MKDVQKKRTRVSYENERIAVVKNEIINWSAIKIFSLKKRRYSLENGNYAIVN